MQLYNITDTATSWKNPVVIPNTFTGRIHATIEDKEDMLCISQQNHHLQNIALKVNGKMACYVNSI